MHRRLASLAALASLAILTTAASAGVVDPSQSTIPSHVNVVGHSGGTPDPTAQFSVTVKDLAGNLLANATVKLDFSLCGDVRISSAELSAGVTANCGLRTLTALTNGAGVATFTVCGASPAGAPTSFTGGGHVLRFYANNILLGNCYVGDFDLDSSGGLGGADLATWLDDFGLGTNPVRTDYDGDSVVGGADLAAWLDAFGGGLQGESGSVLCP